VNRRDLIYCWGRFGSSFPRFKPATGRTRCSFPNRAGYL